MPTTSKTQFLDTTACRPLPNSPDAQPSRAEPPEAKSDPLSADYQKHNPIPREPLCTRGKAKAIRGPPRRFEQAEVRTTTGRPGPQDFGLTKIAYSVLEFIALVGISRASVYEAAAAGDLRLTKMGKRTLILAVDGAAFLHALRERRAGISNGFRRGWSGKPNTKAPLAVAEKLARAVAMAEAREAKVADAVKKRSARARKAVATRKAATPAE
jgi:hypothetical protein